MRDNRRAEWTGLSLMIFVALSVVSSKAHAQAVPESDTEQSDPERVVIQREGMRLIDPKQYQVALVLEPVRQVTIAAPAGGRILSVVSKPGAKHTSGTVMVRLDDTEQTLLVEQAEANLKVAEIEARRAKKQGDADLVDLAEARREAAEAGLKLAKHRLDLTNIRAPFDGEVFDVDVVEGQLVRAGDPLCLFGDPSQLRVEIPVDHKSVKPKQEIELTIDEATVKGTIEHIGVLSEKLEPLRELVQSLATAAVLIDNRGGRLRPGQVADVPIIPRHYVAQVPNGSLANVSDGNRRVQVVRRGVVRDVAVRLLGQVGSDLSYVTGAFSPGDALIVSASQELADGTQLRPAAVAAGPAAAGRANSAGGTTSPKPPPKRVGF